MIIIIEMFVRQAVIVRRHGFSGSIVYAIGQSMWLFRCCCPSAAPVVAIRLLAVGMLLPIGHAAVAVAGGRYVKGAPEMIRSLSQPVSVPHNFGDVVQHYTSRGLRVLALAYKANHCCVYLVLC